MIRDLSSLAALKLLLAAVVLCALGSCSSANFGVLDRTTPSPERIESSSKNGNGPSKTPHDDGSSPAQPPHDNGADQSPDPHDNGNPPQTPNNGSATPAQPPQHNGST